MDDIGPAGAAADALATVSRFWLEVIGARNLELLPELVAADYRLHQPVSSPGAPVEGPAQLRDYLQRIVDAFPRAGATIREQYALSESAVLTNLTLVLEPPAAGPDGETGAAGDGLPAGSYHCVTVNRVAGGQLAETWQFWEAARAEIELEPEIQGWSWRWPPWQWP